MKHPAKTAAARSPLGNIPKAVANRHPKNATAIVDQATMNVWSWFLLREPMVSAAVSKTTHVIEVGIATPCVKGAVIARLLL
ncbi:MAG: hypothetical protein V8R48_12280 [Eggerthella lenta]